MKESECLDILAFTYNCPTLKIIGVDIWITLLIGKLFNLNQEIQKYKMRNSNGSNNRFLMILIFLQFSSFCMKIQILEKNTGWPDEFCIIIFKKKLSNSKFEFEKIRQKIRQNERSFALDSMTVNKVSRIFWRSFLLMPIRLFVAQVIKTTPSSVQNWHEVS